MIKTEGQRAARPTSLSKYATHPGQNSKGRDLCGLWHCLSMCSASFFSSFLHSFIVHPLDGHWFNVYNVLDTALQKWQDQEPEVDGKENRVEMHLGPPSFVP